jgi:uncharacterized protein YndB with AHSA1/START domain
MSLPKSITIQTIVNAPLEKVWRSWNEPQHIIRWAFASKDWEAPHAENDVRIGGRFKTVMAAKDKSTGFDFTGTYTNVVDHELIEYDTDDDRHVQVKFKNLADGVEIIETFEPEKINPEEMQRSGWQAILDNFKEYVEGNK